MATNETLEKYLKAARTAIGDNDKENAKKYFEMAYTEDPTNAEAKFFNSFCNVVNSKKGEVASKFISFCGGVPSCIKLVFEADVSDSEKSKLLSEMFDYAKNFPKTIFTTVESLVNAKVVSYDHLKRVAQEGVKMLYAFGDAVEQYFSSNSEAMKTGIEAWKAGISLQQQWPPLYGIDKTLPEKYTAKVKKFDSSYEMPKKAGCIPFAK